MLTMVLMALLGSPRAAAALLLFSDKPKPLLAVEEDAEEDADEMAQGECCPPPVVPELPEDAPLLAPLEPSGDMGLFFQG